MEGYEPLFPVVSRPGSTPMWRRSFDRLEAAECVFPRVALEPRRHRGHRGRVQRAGLDGILILLLTYSQGQYLVHAMQRNTLPLALALVQPDDETVGDDFEEWGAHSQSGHPRLAGQRQLPLRPGIPCAFFAGSRKTGSSPPSSGLRRGGAHGGGCGACASA